MKFITQWQSSTHSSSYSSWPSHVLEHTTCLLAACSLSHMTWLPSRQDSIFIWWPKVRGHFPHYKYHVNTFSFVLVKDIKHKHIRLSCHFVTIDVLNVFNNWLLQLTETYNVFTYNSADQHLQVALNNFKVWEETINLVWYKCWWREHWKWSRRRDTGLQHQEAKHVFSWPWWLLLMSHTSNCLSTLLPTNLTKLPSLS